MCCGHTTFVYTNLAKCFVRFPFSLHPIKHTSYLLEVDARNRRIEGISIETNYESQSSGERAGTISKPILFYI